MRAPNRFEIVESLPSSRRHLHIAVDRGSHPPRPVVLALYPRALSDDPGRLGRLCGEVERAAQLFHPNVLPPVGIEAVGDDLAAVTVWRDAITLREILDAGGRLPGDIAARIAADVCAGLAHAHGRPEPVVHGLLRPEAVLVDESGIAAVSGFGMPGGSGISDDLLGVGELLHECLVGEPPEGPSAPLEGPGLPSPLVAVVNKARAAQPEARHATADALGAEIAQAVPLAPRETVAEYLEGLFPAGSGLRAKRRRKVKAALAATPSPAPEPEPAPAGMPSAQPEEISEDDIVEDDVVEEDIVGAAASLPGELAAPDPAIAAARLPDSAASTSPPASTAASAAVGSISAPAEAATQSEPATGAEHIAAAEAPGTQRASTGAAAAAAPQAAPPPRRGGLRVSLVVAIAMCLGGVVIGFVFARRAPWISLPSWIPLAEAPTQQPATEVRTRANAQLDTQPSDMGAATDSAPVDATPAPAPAPSVPESVPGKRPSVRHSDAQRSGKPSGASGMGLLEVTAPEDAEVWLDGRRIGKGNTRRQVPVGNHRIEVRQGRARVGEPFHLGPGESWTYAVTPQ